MLQCGLLRSNFALAIHVHLVSPRGAPACKTAAGYSGKRPCSSRKFCANLAAKRLNLGTPNKTAIRRVSMNAQTATAQQSPAPQTPPLPQAKPGTIGLSAGRLQRASDALKREIDKGTIP